MFLKNIFEWGSLKAGRASDEVKKFFPKMLVLALEFEVGNCATSLFIALFIHF